MENETEVLQTNLSFLVKNCYVIESVCNNDKWMGRGNPKYVCGKFECEKGQKNFVS